MKLGLSRYAPWGKTPYITSAMLLVACAVGACSESKDPVGEGGTGGDSSQSGGQSGATGGESSTGGSDGLGGQEGSGGSGTATELRVLTPAELADQSAVDYEDNEHGLVTGTRVQSWLSDWENNRPDEITGRLIILQIEPFGGTSESQIPADEESGIYSYIVPSAELNIKRDNGFSSFETDIPDGAAADAFLEKYDIDPRTDLILLTFEQLSDTQAAVVQAVGRAWVFFEYWGVSNEHLAILNGSVDWNAEHLELPLSALTENDGSTPPNDGDVSVRDLGVDATAAVISLEEILSILKQEDGAEPLSSVRIVDARGGAEALGLPKATSTNQNTCDSYTGTSPNAKCSTPVEGRIKGARSVPWGQFLDTADGGFRYLPYTTVKSAFDTQADWDESISLGILYCRTNQRSTVSAFVAGVILGYPTRFYETSFIEWGYASAGPESSPNKNIVAADFAFRTDLAELTEHAELHPDDAGAYTPGGSLGALTQPVTWVAGPYYNAEEDVPPQAEDQWPLLRSDATTTRLAIDSDRAYLRGLTLDEFLE